MAKLSQSLNIGVFLGVLGPLKYTLTAWYGESRFRAVAKREGCPRHVVRASPPVGELSISSGDLRMYGTRSLNGKHVHRHNPAVEEEEECTRLAGEHALALAALEWAVTPDAAQARRREGRSTEHPVHYAGRQGRQLRRGLTRSRAH